MKENAFMEKFKKEQTITSIIGELIYDLLGDDIGYSPFVLEQIRKKYLSLMTNEYLSYFNSTYTILKEHGHVGEDNTYTYGDIDHSIWIEEHASKRVIVSKSHCSDRQHLFVIDAPHPDFTTFLCVTLEDEEVKNKDYWKDHRDWEKASLKTYRDHDFSFGYGDIRDENHVFKYEQLFQRIERCDNEHGILHALWQLKIDNEMIIDYEENKC